VLRYPVSPWKNSKYWIFWVCVCILALIIRYAKCIFSAPPYIVICGLSGHTISFHFISQMAWLHKNIIQGESLARGPKLLSMYTVEQRGFVVCKYWQTGSFKACPMAFRMEFGERCAPSKCSIQKLIKKLETWGSRSNACRLLSLGPIEGQSVQKYTPYNRTTQRRYTPWDSSRQRRLFGKSIPEFGEAHSSVLGCERRPVSASIMSRSCFASFPLCVYKFKSLSQ